MSQQAAEINPSSTDTPVPNPSPVSTPAVNPDQVFSKADLEAAVEKARQQEKDKLYGKVDHLTQQVEAFTSREQERQAAEEQARREAEEQARLAREADMSAKDLIAEREREWEQRLNTTTQTFEQRLAEIQQEREQEQALLAKERSYSELQAYRTQRLAAEADEIAPQFHDFIQGSTQDEIEQSIAIAKAKSAEVAEQVQAALNAARAGQRGASISGVPPTGPVEYQAGQRTFSAQDIAAMDMNEYIKNRHLFVGNAGSNNRGLYG